MHSLDVINMDIAVNYKYCQPRHVIVYIYQKLVRTQWTWCGMWCMEYTKLITSLSTGVVVNNCALLILLWQSLVFSGRACSSRTPTHWPTTTLCGTPLSSFSWRREEGGRSNRFSLSVGLHSYSYTRLQHRDIYSLLTSSSESVSVKRKQHSQFSMLNVATWMPSTMHLLVSCVNCRTLSYFMLTIIVVES